MGEMLKHQPISAEKVSPEKSQPESKIWEKKEKEKTHEIKFSSTTHELDFDNPEDWDKEKFRQSLRLQKTAGIDRINYDFSWTRINPEQGQFKKGQLDIYTQAKQVMEEEGMETPDIIFTVAPDYVRKLYEGGNKKEFFKAYEDYITQVREALIVAGGKKIETVQIFNELNNKIYTFVEPDDLAEMCQITRDVFKEYNPDIKLKATLHAGSLNTLTDKTGKALKKVGFDSLGEKVGIGIDVKDYLEQNRDMLKENFDSLAINYYPGMWHWPLKEAGLKKRDFLLNFNKTKRIFAQTDLLERVFRELDDMDMKYEIGEYGLPTNKPSWSKKDNKYYEDKQRYAFDVFTHALRVVLKKLHDEGKDLPSYLGLYESQNRRPRNEGEIKTKKRTMNLFPEHDFGLMDEEGKPKELLRGKRGRYTEEERVAHEPHLNVLKRQLNRPL